MSLLRAFFADESGTNAAEFALVLPAFLILLLGTVDVGRWMWWLNEVEKATQVGARHAVVTNLVATGLNTVDLSGACGGGLVAGDRIDCSDAFPTIVCDADSCDCASGDCGDLAGHDAIAFGAITQRMRTIAPYLNGGNVTVAYRPSGIGFYGDPTCLGERDSKTGCSTGELADAAPIVTVRVSSLKFNPITFGLWQGGITIPARSYSLTLEDGYGTAAS